jgi:hypothetical protein
MCRNEHFETSEKLWCWLRLCLLERTQVSTEMLARLRTLHKPAALTPAQASAALRLPQGALHQSVQSGRLLPRIYATYLHLENIHLHLAASKRPQGE